MDHVLERTDETLKQSWLTTREHQINETKMFDEDSLSPFRPATRRRRYHPYAADTTLPRAVTGQTTTAAETIPSGTSAPPPSGPATPVAAGRGRTRLRAEPPHRAA
jgi:hypothetical protein